jgi:hypothetical protein
VKAKRLKPILLLFVIFTGLQNLATAQANYLKITDYKVYYGWASHYPQDWLIIRSFVNEGKNYCLLVDPQTLQTKVDEQGFYKTRPMTWDEARTFFKNTPYIRAIAKAEKRSVGLQDAGIENGMPKQTGISLTADLCPSRRPLDRRIFTEIFAQFGKVERPVPIALSITGVWMRQHPADLQWLKQLQAGKEINITWINHSYNHRVSPTAPLRKNFLLEPGTDINYEVLETEKAMLKNGLTPSVFFRFPGLVSDRQLVYKITDFGLIPVGSDAWLAKGQQARAGSIVLIHANGNEPVGVDDFIRLLHKKAGAIAKKKWLLYDLGESLSGEFEGGTER